MGFKLKILKCSSTTEIMAKLPQSLLAYEQLLPSSKDALILLKPNLNSNMNALTGNTTDLRILSTTILFLKERGYHHIVIGEGTNSGFYRSKIGVISRLKVDKLAAYYGVKVRDFNYAKPREIEFDQGVKAQVASECLEAELFINLPKIKTHFEIGMSVCLKNLMGCLIGQENKKKTHGNLSENILRLNQAVRPHLHIVDGLIAMEGPGPTRGKPVLLNTILVGTDPYLLDLVCSHLAQLDYKSIKTLKLAEEKNLLTPLHHRFVRTLALDDYKKNFMKPKVNPLAAFIHHPKRQKFFLALRQTPVFSYLASTNFGGKLLFLTGLRQDVFLKEEMSCSRLYLDPKLCGGCNLCRDYCPLHLDLPGYLNQIDQRCLGCLYCYLICPHLAIQFEGTLGFLKEQLRQYDALVRGLNR